MLKALMNKAIPNPKLNPPAKKPMINPVRENDSRTTRGPLILDARMKTHKFLTTVSKRGSPCNVASLEKIVLNPQKTAVRKAGKYSLLLEMLP
jgi:hypothetical protein